MDGQRLKRHLFAAGSMLAGSLLVAWMVVAMNAHSKPPKENRSQEAVAFDVEKKKDPPKRPTQQQQRQERKKSTAEAPRAPVPQLASALSGASFGLPAFEADFTQLGANDSVLGDTNKDMVMTEDAVDQPAQPASRAPVEYPMDARKRGIEGQVTLNILVGTDGGVMKAQVLNADPPGVFEDAAKECVKQWEFRAGQYQGSAVAMWVKQTIRFKLQ